MTNKFPKVDLTAEEYREKIKSLKDGLFWVLDNIVSSSVEAVEYDGLTDFGSWVHSEDYWTDNLKWQAAYILQVLHPDWGELVIKAEVEELWKNKIESLKEDYKDDDDEEAEEE